MFTMNGGKSIFNTSDEFHAANS